MFKRVRIEHLTWRKNQGFDVWFLFLRSERGLFAIAKQQVLADSGEHLRRDVEERGDGVEREMLNDAGAATEQLVVTLVGCGTVEVLITGLELVEHVLALNWLSMCSPISARSFMFLMLRLKNCTSSSPLTLHTRQGIMASMVANDGRPDKTHG